LQHAVVEQFPRMEGRQMVMVLSPKKKEVKAAKPKATKPKVEKVASGAASNAPKTEVDSAASTEVVAAEAEK
jgi:hypothetical protein